MYTNHDQCFVCGKDNPCSLGLEFLDWQDGVHAVFQPKPEHQGYNGILHGGIIAALLDEAMTHCLFRYGIKAVTGDLRVRYLHPVTLKAPIELRARLLSDHKHLYKLRSELITGNLLMVWAEGKFVQRKDNATLSIAMDATHLSAQQGRR